MRLTFLGLQIDIRTERAAEEELNKHWRMGVSEERRRVEKKRLLIAQKARAGSTKKALKKIQDALEKIEKYGKDPSEYMIQKYSGVSINTVKKYRAEIQEYLRSK